VRDLFEQYRGTIGVSAAMLVIGFLVALLFVKPSPPPIEIRTITAQPTPTVTIFVHVEGAIQSPGVYRLGSDARIFEAIDAAGGPLATADTSSLNLAARLTDGQKLFVPGQGAAAAPTSPSVNATLATTGVGGAASNPRINVNTATQRMLESLPGIGPVTAQRIIQWRTTNGRFSRVEQLREAGVNASTYARIQDLVSVD
jgi:competence protein ComEA